MSRHICGSASMAKGIRIPVDSSLLETLLEGVQQHADWKRPCPSLLPIQELAGRYQHQDYKLYDLAALVASEVDSRDGVNLQLGVLRQAILNHSQRRLNACIWGGAEDFSRQIYDDDIELYDVARQVRFDALQIAPDPGIYLEPRRLKAVVTGKSTVMLMPAEFNRAGECLPPYYKVGGGKGGTYALLRPADEQAQISACVVPHRRLKITSVGLKRLGDVSDADARLAGFRDIPELIEHGTVLHGHLPFEWEFWRFEFEVVAV